MNNIFSRSSTYVLLEVSCLIIMTHCSICSMLDLPQHIYAVKWWQPSDFLQNQNSNFRVSTFTLAGQKNVVSFIFLFFSSASDFHLISNFVSLILNLIKFNSALRPIFTSAYDWADRLYLLWPHPSFSPLTFSKSVLASTWYIPMLQLASGLWSIDDQHLLVDWLNIYG